ncbi:hypothetical protein [Marinobacterium jannaschii]|uniref:hypothetical protein n=1 Tax=Marinobacterium jannaschii TaxID=64970 RepID=UPI00048020D1|nr:hypothetical protein [Marinobacterium jannaschii]
MYEFYYDNFTAPAGWFLLFCLIAASVCHMMVLYFGMKIEQAVKAAQSKVQNVQLTHVAVNERELLAIWTLARRLFLQVSPLFLFAWLVGLGRPGY